MVSAAARTRHLYWVAFSQFTKKVPFLKGFRVEMCEEHWMWRPCCIYAIDIINADSNLLPGVELGYDIRDTCFSETVGLEEAFDLILTGSNLVCRATNQREATNDTAYDHVPTSGIIGAGGSRVSVPVASLGRLFEMPQISYSSTSPLLSDRARYSYFRRTVPSDDLQVLAIVGILKRFNWSYVSIIYSEDAYGSAGVVNISAVSTVAEKGHPILPLRTHFHTSIGASALPYFIHNLLRMRKVIIYPHTR